MKKAYFSVLLIFFALFPSCKVTDDRAQLSIISPLHTPSQDDDLDLGDTIDDVNSTQSHLVNIYSEEDNYKYTDSEIEFQVIQKIESKLDEGIICKNISKVSSKIFCTSDSRNGDRIDLIRYAVVLSDGRIVDAICTDDKRAGAVLHYSDPYSPDIASSPERDAVIKNMMDEYLSYIISEWNNILSNYDSYLKKTTNSLHRLKSVSNNVEIIKNGPYIKTAFDNNRLYGTVLVENGIKETEYGFCAAVAAAQIPLYYDLPIMTYKYKDFNPDGEDGELKGDIEMSNSEIRDLILNPRSDKKSKMLRQRLINKIIYEVYDDVYYDDTKYVRYGVFSEFAKCYYKQRVWLGDIWGDSNGLKYIESYLPAFRNEEVLFAGLKDDKSGHAVLLDGVDYNSSRPQDTEIHINWGWGGRKNGWYKFSALLQDVNGMYITSATSYGHPQNSERVAKLDLGYDDVLYNASEELNNAVRIKGDDFGFSFVANKKNWDGKLYYAKSDDPDVGVGDTIVSWKEWDGSKLKDCYELYIKGEGNTTLRGLNNTKGLFYQMDPIFTGSAEKLGSTLSCSGDIMNLLDYKKNIEHKKNGNSPVPTMAPYCFAGLFKNNRKMTFDDLKLPSGDLSPYCYYGMFYNCASMEKPPALPASWLKEHCYDKMFWGCKSLKYLPALPYVASPDDGCYWYMFAECDSLEVSTNSKGSNYFIQPGRVSKYSNADYSYMFAGVDDYNTGKPIEMTYYTTNVYTKNEPIGFKKKVDLPMDSEGKYYVLPVPESKTGKLPSTDPTAVRVSVPKAK